MTSYFALIALLIKRDNSPGFEGGVYPNWEAAVLVLSEGGQRPPESKYALVDDSITAIRELIRVG